MTEEKAPYQVGNGPEFTLEDLAGRDCARKFSDPRYRPPTPEEVNGLIKLAGWSQNEAAKIAGLNYLPNEEFQQINYAVWRLMLITAGVVSQ
jgi:hypothetical protein